MQAHSGAKQTDAMQADVMQADVTQVNHMQTDNKLQNGADTMQANHMQTDIIQDGADNNTVTAASKFYLLLCLIFIGTSFLFQIVALLGFVVWRSFTDPSFAIETMTSEMWIALERELVAHRAFLVSAIIVTQVLGLFLPAYIYCRVKKVNIKKVLRFRKVKGLPILIMTLATPSLMFFASSVNNLIVSLFMDINKVAESQPIPAPEDVSTFLILAAVVGIVPSLFEEFVCRGVFLTAFEKRGTVKAILFSSILFGMMHFNFANLIATSLLGAVFAYYVLRTNSIFSGMFAHFTNNVFAVSMMFVMTRFASFFEQLADMGQLSDGTAAWPEGPVIMAMGFLMVALFYGAISFALLYWFHRVTRETAVAMKPSISKITFDLRCVGLYWPIVLSVVLFVGMAMMSYMSM